jgi:hypothetical protein
MYYIPDIENKDQQEKATFNEHCFNQTPATHNHRQGTQQGTERNTKTNLRWTKGLNIVFFYLRTNPEIKFPQKLSGIVLMNSVRFALLLKHSLMYVKPFQYLCI